VNHILIAEIPLISGLIFFVTDEFFENILMAFLLSDENISFDCGRV